MTKVLVTGAGSAIAQACARIWARRGWDIFLVDINEQRVNIVADDLRVRGAKHVTVRALDMTDNAQHVNLLNQAGDIDLLFIAHGSMADQTRAEQDWKIAQQDYAVNFLSVTALLTEAANQFEKKGQGRIAVLSSPAGDRGRQSNYVYGAAKGALTVFLSGLRNRLADTNVVVTTIKPALITTPLTAHMEKGLLWVQPDTIASQIVRAIDTKQDILYVPWFWRYIMLLIVHIPEPIFKRMKL